MTQLNKTAVSGVETGPVGVLAPQPRAGAVSAASGRGRHSTRISVSLPVLVQDNLGTREQALTHSVCSRGAVLVLKSNVRVAQKVTIQNLKNGKTAECHVIGVENMVNQVHKVEVEFTQPQPEFWPVLFPQEKEENHSSEMGNGHRHIDSGNRAALSGDQSGSSVSRVAKPAADSQHIGSDPLLDSSGEPQFAQDSDFALVLAAPIKQESLAQPAFHVQSFSASAATMDSVAQFRAATRSASRRKQRIRGISSAGSVAMILCAFFAGKTVLRHHPIKTWQSSSAALPQMASASTIVQPETNVGETTNAPGSDSSAAPVSQPVDASEAVLTASSGGEQITLEAPGPGPATEIAVRHGVTLSSEQKLALAEDEPIALPLRSAAETRPGAEINQVLNRTPHANAVLAPQSKPVLRPARLLSTVQPEYPATARQYRVEGEVVLTVEVDASGNVANVKAVSGPPMLRIAAAGAVRRWKYQPATLGDKPVSSSMTAKLDFHLR